MSINHKPEAPVDLRVLLVDLSRRYGGASVRALTLASNLKPWIAAIVGLEDSPVVKIARAGNIPVRTVGKSRVDPRIPFRLRDIIRQDGFQILDTQNIQSKFWGSLTALMTDVAFVATHNSSYQNEQGRSLKGLFYTLVDRWTDFRTDRYIAVSDPIQKDLLKTGISETMVDLITNAVEVDSSWQMADVGSIRSQMGIPQDAFVCVSVGRLVWAKGYEDFIAAFASVARQVPNAYAVILGDGVLRTDLSQKIKTAGLEHRFILLGHCEPAKVMSVLNASDVFVSSSRSEGVPYAVLEAAAHALPILATRCGGIPDVLADGEEAILVPIGDSDAMASGIIRLAQNRELAHKLGANAREKIKRNHGILAQIEATRSAYRKALEHKPRN